MPYKGVICVIKEFKSGDIVIKIDYDKCTGVGTCVEECPIDIYEVQDEKAVANNVGDCIECCLCVDACPNGAIQHSTC
jgi:NAD-dependent dihydropyrimidine dehydrogenase PreA subunit